MKVHSVNYLKGFLGQHLHVFGKTTESSGYVEKFRVPF